MGCRLWGRTELDTTKATWQQQQQQRIYMEFRKMVMITLYARQQKKQMYRTVFWTLWESEEGDDLGEWH